MSTTLFYITKYGLRVANGTGEININEKGEITLIISVIGPIILCNL